MKGDFFTGWSSMDKTFSESGMQRLCRRTDPEQTQGDRRSAQRHKLLKEDKKVDIFSPYPDKNVDGSKKTPLRQNRICY